MLVDKVQQFPLCLAKSILAQLEHGSKCSILFLPGLQSRVKGLGGLAVKSLRRGVPPILLTEVLAGQSLAVPKTAER